MRELSASAAKFEALFNQSGIFAGIIDLDGYLREANNLSLVAGAGAPKSRSLTDRSEIPLGGAAQKR